MTNFLTINNDCRMADKKDIEAQKQWELKGTVSADYLKRVLGDISQAVSIQGPDIKKRKDPKQQQS
jgi:hypothetical protein